MMRSHKSLDDDPQGSRHVSIRVPLDLFHRLEAAASEHHETVSQVARRLIGNGLEPGGRNALDDAIAILMSARDRQVTQHRVVDSNAHGPSAIRRHGPKRIDILNAKTDLQRLLSDVSRGDEYVITHAGAPRARLVGVGDHTSRTADSE